MNINLSGLLLNVNIKFKFLYFFSYTLKIHNTKEDYTKIIVGNGKKKKDYNANRLVDKALTHIKQDLRDVRLLMRMNIKLKTLKIKGELGFSDRADITALSVGGINGGLAAVIRNKGEVNILPNYAKNCFELNIFCIINGKVANIIFDTIRFFIWRKKHGTSN